MSPASKNLPDYLKKYVSVQNYEKYSPRDHAAWRFIMRQNRAFFSKNAAPVYLEGLKKTGIPIDRIPKISEMDECLAAFGWGAVPVEGFIPPAAFLDFQARSVLPIASDMRSVDHIAYTPAPDIVHEAAGHAPILADPAYAKYLHRYAQLARKAIFSAHDVRSYEAIRSLSDIKENPDTHPEEIAAAEQRLAELGKETHPISENTKVTRMNWWTVEFGLVGTLKDPKIYGAGLLSSVGESQACLSERVKKIPLTLECIDFAYDITEPQPQLFVTPDLEHLVTVLEELEQTMSFVRGGVYGLEQARASETITTTVLDSGLEISGRVEDIAASSDSITFLRWSGPVQLSREERELPGHGTRRHPQGFSSPFGRWKAFPNRPATTLTDSELASCGLRNGAATTLDFVSGIRVKGTLVSTTRAQDRLLLLTWKDCTVTRGSEVLFQPSWGEFDLAVGEEVTSVFGAPADRAAYGEFDVGQAQTSPGRKTPYTPRELEIFKAYEWIRSSRADLSKADAQALDALANKLISDDSDEWLLAVELFELSNQMRHPAPWDRTLRRHLGKISHRLEDTTSQWIAKGLALSTT